MNIIIDKNKIFGPVSKIVSITEKRSLMPILSNILLEFGKEGTTIFSTDLEVSAIAYIDCKVEKERKIVVHGRKFLEVLRELEGGEIHFLLEENQLTIKQKRTEIKMSLQDPEEFPETKEVKGKEEFIIGGKMFLDMIEKVGFAVSTDETRYILTGMYMQGLDGELIMVGTDGFRMALCQRKIKEIKGFKGVTIPKRSVIEAERIIEDEDEVRVSIEEKYVQFSTEKLKIITRIIEGNFPDYENVLPANNQKIIKVEKDAFHRGLKRVSAIIGRNEPVKITLSEKNMEIDAESDVGRAKEDIEIEYEGEKTNMSFNVRFILDVVTHISGEKVIMTAPPTYGAVLFRGEQEEDYKNIVMPIRI
ncbi:MAG TPA: DNA polymerase III subunit beta [Syntrophorhabdaceae bacterium]|nr:DNA polymerase III subunit beta [Syntrophorhabdaceae bacterium]HQM81560.1 DNA polymerase III subunit beta [Syntrophorhabdaceae bacterium]